ncbi:TRAP-type C4-dicarboxylate transport system substrate-binding protein [Fluviicoccus keumensis]|uniref:TRAP-type C4-dicarboxylate transport system substrate-binding protein n=1 Tax=Fluviicoccus keumensis TaxID=1435465 RepID=A0A4Q7ZAH2_9GAMM|nr:TRAP transporter substrate-binding protein DctP [Fluviicoccus keumensis]RZU47587.1 TRAP-type C4-dicarboxylate transport system substrate-binding protein [Fluviicoccus keumensis]
MKKIGLLCIGIIAGMLSAESSALTLKIATLSPDGSGWMTKMRAGAGEVDKRTQGRVQFKFYTGGTMGNDRSVLSKIKIGQLQGGAVTAGSLTDFNRDVQIYAMPLKFKNFNEVDAVRGKMDSMLSRSLEQGGMVNFGFAEAGFAYAMSKTGPISSVAELRKHKVWIPENDPQSAEALKAFQVSPIPLSLADVLPGLQTGIVDTVASSPIGALALQWHTQVRYVTELPLSYIVGVLAIDQKAFAKIDPADQAVVREVMTRVFREIDKQNRQDNLAAWEALQKQGIKAVRPSSQEVEEWEKDAQIAGERIVKAGIVSPQVMQVLEENLKQLRSGRKQ